MAVVLLLLAVGHLPRFPGDLAHEAEPSLASYNTQASTYSISYEEGDYMHVVVYRPSTLGFQYKVHGDIAYDVDFVGDCALGAAAKNDHAKIEAAGTEIYEPFGESSLVVVKTVVSERISPIKQTCYVKVSLSHTHLPYVVVTGTTEEVFEVFAVGLPYYVLHISAWVGNFVYPAILLGCVAVGFAFGLLTPRYLAALALVSTAANRLAQIAVVGLGLGQLFVLGPLLVAVAVVVVSRWWLRVLTVALAWLSPTHWYVDAVLVTFALLYHGHR